MKNRNRILNVFLVVLIGVGMVVLATIMWSTSRVDVEYKQFTIHRDPERRWQCLGPESEDLLIDKSAFVGLPDLYSEATADYSTAVLSAIQAEPIRRKRYYSKSSGVGDPLPGLREPVFDREVIVPLVLLPRPASISRWCKSANGRSLGWRSDENAGRHRGSVYGRTVFFQPGEQSKLYIRTLPIPFEDTYYWDLGFLESEDAMSYQKVVVVPAYNTSGEFRDQASFLRLGEQDGATFLGEIVTVPVCLQNSRLYWVEIRYPSGNRRFLAYALLDGNGAGQPRRNQSPYVRPLTSKHYQPKIDQHDELLLPTPIGWAPTEQAKNNLKLEDIPHEEWCLDDWFPAQKDACWVIREAEDSKPLQESFLLMPASEKSDRPVFFIALFAETEPKQLLKELAALYKVSPDKALNSPETMRKLQSLYENVRDFPLDR